MPKHYQKDAIFIFLLLAFIFGYFYQDGRWNGNSRFDLIFAIVQQRRLTIDNYQNQPGMDTGDKAYFNGHYYSDKAPGPALIGSVLYLPLYWMKQGLTSASRVDIKKILTYLVIGIPSALAGSLIYILCLYFSRNRFRAYLVTLTVTLGTMYFPYSIIFFSHQFSSSLLFGAFFLIFFIKERQLATKTPYLFLIGLLLGWAFISEYPTAIIIIPLIAYYIYVLWGNHNISHLRSIIFPILGLSIPAFIQLVYNKLCFGSYLSIGYQNLSNSQFNSGMAQGLMGINRPSLHTLFYMTLHPTLGIFWQSPALLLSIVGAVIVLANRQYRVEAILAMWIIVSYLVIISGYYMWWGGSALGPRDIIPMLPYFCIFLVFIPKRLTWPLLVLSLVSIGQMLIAAASNVNVPATTVSKIKTMGFFAYSNIYSYCLKQLQEGHFAQNLGQQLLGLRTWSSLIPLLIVISIFTFFFLNGMGIFHPQKRPSLII